MSDDRQCYECGSTVSQVGPFFVGVGGVQRWICEDCQERMDNFLDSCYRKKRVV